MKNLLSEIIEKAAESILQHRLSKSMPKLPDPDEEEERMKEDLGWDNLSEEEKEKKKPLIDNLKSSIKDAVNKQKESIKNAAKDNISGMNEIKADLNNLGTSAGLLTVGSAEFAMRAGMVPVAIISTTPVGPGVSTNMITPMMKDLKGEGDNLSKVYDDCENGMNKLGIQEIVNSGESVPGVDLSPVSSVYSIVTGAMSTAKPMILAVGSDVGGEIGNIPDIKPPIDVELSAQDCSQFSPKLPNDGISPSNCRSYSPMGEGLDIKCSNCKNYQKR